MEVHHHSPTSRKKWTHYFWEFLMLFLAVFCGFLAEYQLEHKIEKDRAKELAKSFYEELKNDSATAMIKVQSRKKQEEALTYLMHYFKDSSLENVSKTFVVNFQYGINFRTPSVFEPRTTMLEQLRNSGSLRYFKNEELQKLIGDLTVTIKNIYDRQELETQNRALYINPLIIEHYDYDFDTEVKKLDSSVFNATKKYAESERVIPFHFRMTGKFDRQHTVNLLGFYNANVINSTRIVFIQRYLDLNRQLLNVLRKEYHLQ
jgi:hypothetical protein